MSAYGSVSQSLHFQGENLENFLKAKFADTKQYKNLEPKHFKERDGISMTQSVNTYHIHGDNFSLN